MTGEQVAYYGLAITLLSLLIRGVWSGRGILSKIYEEIKLMRSEAAHSNKTIEDHETRIRVLENEKK